MHDRIQVVSLAAKSAGNDKAARNHRWNPSKRLPAIR
jgi:hypothetical protein